MFTKKFSRRFLAASLAIGAFTFTPNFGAINFFPTVQAEIKTYTGVGKCVQGDLITIAQAKNYAKLRAELNAKEQAGVYLRGYAKAENFNLTENKIEVITAGILNIVGDVQYKTETTMFDDSPVVRYIATLQANIDSDEINAYIRREDKAELQSAQKDIKENLDKIDNLIERYNAATSQAEKEKIRAELSDADREILAGQKFEEGNKFFSSRSYQDEQKAIELYTEAIKLNPNYSDAYSNRGRVYSRMTRYDQAIEDCNRAIEINPNNAHAYYIRGRVYSDLAGEYNIYGLGLGDYNKIKYTVDDSEFYNRAIADYTKVITLNPNYAWAYNNRGYVYHKLKQYTIAIANYTKAIELEPNNPTYYNNRAEAYKSIGETEKALADNKKFTKLAFSFYSN